MDSREWRHGSRRRERKRSHLRSHEHHQQVYDRSCYDAGGYNQILLPPPRVELRIAPPPPPPPLHVMPPPPPIRRDISPPYRPRYSPVYRKRSPPPPRWPRHRDHHHSSPPPPRPPHWLAGGAADRLDSSPQNQTRFSSNDWSTDRPNDRSRDQDYSDSSWSDRQGRYHGDYPHRCYEPHQVPDSSSFNELLPNDEPMYSRKRLGDLSAPQSLFHPDVGQLNGRLSLYNNDEERLHSPQPLVNIDEERFSAATQSLFHPDVGQLDGRLSLYNNDEERLHSPQPLVNVDEERFIDLSAPQSLFHSDRGQLDGRLSLYNTSEERLHSPQPLVKVKEERFSAAPQSLFHPERGQSNVPLSIFNTNEEHSPPQPLMITDEKQFINLSSAQPFFSTDVGQLNNPSSLFNTNEERLHDLQPLVITDDGRFNDLSAPQPLFGTNELHCNDNISIFSRLGDKNSDILLRLGEPHPPVSPCNQPQTDELSPLTLTVDGQSYHIEDSLVEDTVNESDTAVTPSDVDHTSIPMDLCTPEPDFDGRLHEKLSTHSPAASLQSVPSLTSDPLPVSTDNERASPHVVTSSVPSIKPVVVSLSTPPLAVSTKASSSPFCTTIDQVVTAIAQSVACGGVAASQEHVPTSHDLPPSQVNTISSSDLEPGEIVSDVEEGELTPSPPCLSPLPSNPQRKSMRRNHTMANRKRPLLKQQGPHPFLWKRRKRRQHRHSNKRLSESDDEELLELRVKALQSMVLHKKANIDKQRSSMDPPLVTARVTDTVCPNDVPPTSGLPTPVTVPLTTVPCPIIASSTTAPPPIVAPPITAPPLIIAPPITAPPPIVAPPTTAPPLIIAPPTTVSPIVAPPTTALPLIAPLITASPPIIAPPTTAPPIGPPTTAPPIAPPTTALSPIITPPTTSPAVSVTAACSSDAGNISSAVVSDVKTSETSSVKVITSLNDTWNVKEFRIVSDGDETDIEDSSTLDNVIVKCRILATAHSAGELKTYLSSLTEQAIQLQSNSHSLKVSIQSLTEQLKEAQENLIKCEESKKHLQHEIATVKSLLKDKEQTLPDSILLDSNCEKAESDHENGPKVAVSESEPRLVVSKSRNEFQLTLVSNSRNESQSMVFDPRNESQTMDSSSGNDSQTMDSSPRNESQSTASNSGNESQTMDTNSGNESSSATKATKQELLQKVKAKTQELVQVKQNYLDLLKRKKNRLATKTKFVPSHSPFKSRVKKAKPSTSSPLSSHKLRFKPHTSAPKPHTSAPKPHTSAPKPHTSAPKPHTSAPKPHTTGASKPRSNTLESQSSTSKSHTKPDNASIVKKQLQESVESLGESYTDDIYDFLQSWKPSLEEPHLPPILITDVNIVTGRCLYGRVSPVKLNASLLLQSNDKPSGHCIRKADCTRAYESPLLIFRAYRTNPLYRTLFKLPLSSLTYSHSIDPFTPMCRYQSRGKCHNPSCTAQHWDTVTLSDDVIADQLLCYYPEITPPDSNLRQQMSSSEWLLLTAHSIHQHQRSVLPASERCETAHTTASCHQEGLVPNPVVTEQLKFAKKRETRYFDISESLSETDSILQQVQELSSNGDLEKAESLLKQAISDNPSEERFWIAYVTVNPLISEQALEKCPCNSVYRQVVKASKTGENKKRRLLSIYEIVKTDQPSHLLLELLLNYIALDILNGHTQSAKDLLQVLFERKETALFKDVLELLTTCDKVFLGLVYLYLMATDRLPFSAGSVPFSIISKKHFFIPWKKEAEEQVDQYMNTFKFILAACTDKDIPIEEVLEASSSIYINLFLFEVLQGRYKSSMESIDRLLLVAPNLAQLRLFHYAMRQWQSEEVLVSYSHHPLICYSMANTLLKQDKTEEAGNILCQCVNSCFDTVSEPPRLLYRKLLGLTLPYKYQAPALKCDVTGQLASWWLCYCLFVRSMHLEDAEEAYESAINSVHPERSGYSQIWLDYIVFLISRANSTHSIKALMIVLKRSLQVLPEACHYDVLYILEQCTDDSAALMEILSSLIEAGCTCPILTLKYLEYGLKYRLIDERKLNSFYRKLSVDHYGMLIVYELSCNRYREARWLYQQLINCRPLSQSLWNQFLLFELAGLVCGYSNQALVKTVIGCSREYDVQLTPVECMFRDSTVVSASE